MKLIQLGIYENIDYELLERVCKKKTKGGKHEFN